MKRILLILPIMILLLTIPVKANTITNDDIKLIASVTISESGNQCILGQRYVIDTILNRIDHDDFPDNAYDVINSPNQYSKGRPVPTDDVVQIVKEEIKDRTNDKVLYFRTQRYHGFGIPVTKIHDHYFSTK